MRQIITFCLFVFPLLLSAQKARITGTLNDAENQAAAFASVALYAAKDSNLAKVAVSKDNGGFAFEGLSAGAYFLKTSFVGYADLIKTGINLTDGQSLDLGTLRFSTDGILLTEAVVSATRRMVEVKPDRTVFNVEGTINATGSNGIELLRKAPGVQVDNNNNLVVLGRSGVLVYIDGKRLPLSGQELSSYLQNLQAAQIDRIDIITNPGAKYEAEGNAGIIDIKLKRDKNLGANGSVNTTMSQGRYNNYNLSATGTYRNKLISTFGNIGYNKGIGFNNMLFLSQQNGLLLDEQVFQKYRYGGPDWRIGNDFFIGKKHTVGFMASGNINQNNNSGDNIIALAQNVSGAAVDSVLVAETTSDEERLNQAYNLNYRFDNGKSGTINLDLDYGTYQLDALRFQPNRYFDASRTNLLTEAINQFDTPSDIQIKTAKLDFERPVSGGQLGAGAKISNVTSDNTFLFYDVANNMAVRNDRKSNTFLYDENVLAGYVNYARPINKRFNFSAGVRAEQTDAKGTLTTFDVTLQEPPVKLNYLSWFPSAGLTYQKSPMHVWSANYGRRINRPDYNVLNPFNNQLSQLSYEKGNPFLRPEIVNNYELGYTMFYAFNFKLAYSVTADQITRLISPDDVDPRSSYITWDNLAEQRTTSFNISAPFTIKKWWELYFNGNATHINNKADYGNGAVVDVQVFNYSFYQQSTFSLPKGYKAEVSGWYSGPGVWGGVFLFESSYSLDFGLQKKFLKDQLTVRLSASDIFYQSYWSGYSKFNGLLSEGSGRNDTRRVGINLNYLFGNQNVKARNRKSGMDAEAGRVKK
jgi:iron complex outermembrane recepter protein